MRTPVKIAFVTVLVTQTLAVILMQPLGHAGLTLATSLGACVNAALLFWFLRRHGFYAPAPAGSRSCPSSWSRWACWPPCSIGWRDRRSSGSRRAVAARRRACSGVIAAGAAAYFGALFLLGFRLRDFNRKEALPPTGGL